MLRIGLSTTARGPAFALTIGVGEGVGTFVWHLVGGLLELAEPLQIVVTALPGDRERLALRLPRDKRLTVMAVDPGEDGTFAGGGDVDVWVLPSIHCHRPATAVPSVVFVHDLVTEHVPELFDEAFRAAVLRTTRDLVSRATFVACMSAFTRDHDLLGALALDPARVKMVRSAWPTDLPALTSAEARALLPVELPRPYLLFPSGYSPHKNHAVLIEALWRLRDYYGVDELDLAFTGGERGAIAQPLADLTVRYGLDDRVQRIGPVSREALAALYREAFMTIVPTLHEQGSYPVAEALGCGCPVACSDIPALREQCEPLGAAMRYFDPRDPHSVARCVLAICDARDDVVREQSEAARAFREPRWDQVAAAWLEIFREAAGSAASANTAAY